MPPAKPPAKPPASYDAYRLPTNAQIYEGNGNQLSRTWANFWGDVARKAGRSLTWRGAFSDQLQYRVNDLVSDGDTLWCCLSPNPQNNNSLATEPSADGPWDKLISTAGLLADPTTATGDLIVRGPKGLDNLPLGSNGQVLTVDTSQPLGMKWAAVSGGAGAVSSVFGRTGAVIAASGDYTAAQVTNAVDKTQAYADPAWITSLAYSKLTGAPTIPTVYWQAGTGGAIYYSGGNVGIGTASPQAPLHVHLGTDLNAAVSLSGGQVAVSSLNDAFNAYAPMYIQGSSVWLNTTNVGIGPSPATPQGRLNIIDAVNNTAATLRLDVQYGAVGDYCAIGWGGPGSATANSGIVARAYAGGQMAFDFRLQSAGSSTLATAVNVMTIAGSGNVGIGTASPGHLLTVGSSGTPAYCDGTTWVNGSASIIKRDFIAIDAQDILARLKLMPVQSWAYVTDKHGVKRLGPTAEDFYAAFKLGEDNGSISTVDEGGVALAAIQGLLARIEALEAKVGI